MPASERIISAATIWVAIGAISASPVLAQERLFTGAYLGVEAGRQNIVGGSDIGGVDFLQQEDRNVVTVFGGVRYQFGSGLVLGAEAGFGRTDGDLTLAEPSRGLKIEYRNDSQASFGLVAGYVVGARQRWLLFGYLSEVTRTFDVEVQVGDSITPQSDEQGMLRFGAGVETRLAGRLDLRLAAGTGRADFGDRETNTDVERRLEVGLGVLLRL